MTLPTGEAAQLWRRWFARHPDPPKTWAEVSKTASEHPARRARPPKEEPKRERTDTRTD